MDNRILEKYFQTEGIDPRLPRLLDEIVRETGFEARKEIQRRFIYDPAKTWRVRIIGTFEEKPAILQVDALKLETDEEEIRKLFRQQATGSHVRPPHVYQHQPFDDAKGYAYSIEEDVTDMPILFDPAGDPSAAVAAFGLFYRELRSAVVEPFWPTEWKDARAYSIDQCEKWFKLAQEKDPEHTKIVEPIVMRLKDRLLASVKETPLRFMHAHLSGSDVRVSEVGEWVIFANYFWSWRQPGYDIAFPLWGQWMALPFDKRTPENIRTITETWLDAVRRELGDLVSSEDLRLMLLNRLYGSVLLDIPAKRSFEPKEAVDALEAACIAEAERLLAV